jgi:hypothetical protein
MGNRTADAAEMVEPKRIGELGAGRGARHRRVLRAPEPWEFELLRLIAEQGAIPFDQLARFLDCDERQAASVAKHLTKVGYADYGRFLHDQPHWVWLTHRGARFSGTAFEAVRPKVGAMARMRAVNEVRLHIARRAPEARWICGRSVVREQGMKGKRPNAVVEIGAERHAIVVKHGVPHEQARELRIIETHIARYDAVIYFANPRPRALLERLKAEHHWPKLVIRPIPNVAIS